MLVLKRQEERRGATIGNIFYNDVFITSCFELPWRDNAEWISCIPPGTYGLEFKDSPKFKRKLLTVLDIPGRKNVRFHPANKTHELQGCIAPFMTASVVNNEFFGSHSAKALANLEKVVRDNGIKSITVLGVSDALQ